MTKEFGAKLPTYAERVTGETARVAMMLQLATPPAEMRAAPVAPARGVMQLVQDFDLLPGGTRRASGAHWIQPMRLDLDNSAARGKSGSQAVDAAEDRQFRKTGAALTDAEREATLRKVDVFTPAQIGMAARYRDLVEWRAGSGIKCAKLEAGMGGGGSDYLDRFMDAGAELRRLEAAIGAEVVLSPRRHLDRGNARGILTLRQAVDAVILRGWSLSRVIERAGWEPKGTVRRTVRDAIRGALDRMQGYAA